jgi:hypothetical protein
MVIVDGDYHSGRQVRVIKSTKIIQMPMRILFYIQRTLTCVSIGHIYYTQILCKIQQNSKIRRKGKIRKVPIG